MAKSNQSYAPPEFQGEIKLPLNRNESICAISELGHSLIENAAQVVSRYPSAEMLQEALGEWLKIDHQRLVITAGGDEGIERIIRRSLNGPESRVLTHAPSFEMFDIYAHNSGGEIRKVVWEEGEFPTNQFLSQLDSSTSIAIVVSPNNPTGLRIETPSLIKIAEECQKRNIPFLVDCAYVEFSDEDPTQSLAKISSVTMVRTFSKAWGLAGSRVGYLIAPSPEEAAELRASVGPFPVSGMSLKLAYDALTKHREQMEFNVNRIKQYRSQVARLVELCGGSSFDSKGNFVFARFEDAESLWLRLAERGVGVRKFAHDSLKQNLRITIPTNVSDLMHLSRAMSDATGVDFDLSSIVGDENAIPETPNSSTPVSTDSPSRKSLLQRKTKETDITIELELDGNGDNEISTGIGFLDHMLTALTFHSRMNLKLRCKGDLHIDDHHTAEDCALALGTAISDALGERKGIKRFGYAYAPLDEALARTVLDLSGRPWPEVHLDLQREMVGTIATENLTHFFQSLAMTLKCSLHVDVLRGDNDHHKAEAAFKSLALALKSAISSSGNDVPSTKGVL